ncbi:MAG: Nif3-like dinuclear metal center hexameric protein [Gaiellales bacterium]
MTAHRDDILALLDDELEIARFRDYGPQGLQVAGRAEVRRVAVAVSSTLEVFEQAEASGADLLIVHHGLFWDGDSRVVDELLRRRLETLFRAGITLAAYHLPLDAHRTLGNNAELARILGVEPEGWFLDDRGAALAVRGPLVQPCSLDALAASLEQATGRRPLSFPGGPALLERIGICSGGAARAVRLAAELGLDAWVTGEPSEDSRALSRELGISFVAGGHYATETFGVRALARLLEQRFELETSFIDVANPV